MAAVFAFSRYAAKEFCKKKSFPKLFLSRSRRFNQDGRIQHRKRLGQRENHPEAPENESKLKMLMRPLGFTLMTGVVSFGTCSILHYERVRHSYQHGNKSPSTESSNKQFGIRDTLNKWWNSLPGGSKTASVIIFLNTTVFLLWGIPRMYPFMWKWFTMSPGPGPSLRLLTSTFSHMDFWHLGVNMFVLWSFAPPVEALLGKEQFIAFYLTGGVFASFVSVAYKTIVTSASFGLGASLGASGALFAVLGLWCLHQPDSKLAIVFLPFFTFSAGTGLIAIVGLDLTGLIFRWRSLDHAAHLGGVLFGAFYLKYGHHYLWDKRGWLVTRWHKLRSGDEKRT